MSKKGLVIATALGAAMGFGGKAGFDGWHALQNAKRLQAEADQTFCYASRAAIDHILANPERYGIDQQTLDDFKRRRAIHDQLPCNSTNSREAMGLLYDMRSSNPAPHSPMDDALWAGDPNLKPDAEAFEALNDIDFLASVGLRNMRRAPRLVTSAAIRLAQDQRVLMKTFLRRPQAR